VLALLAGVRLEQIQGGSLQSEPEQWTRFATKNGLACPRRLLDLFSPGFDA
jgi:hypothetical protein